MWAMNAFISLTAKKRPGLKVVLKLRDWLSNYEWVGITHQACRPTPNVKWSEEVAIAWCLFTMASPSSSQSFEKRKPSNLSGFGYISSFVSIALSGSATNVFGGMVTPLENVNGRKVRRTEITAK